MMDNESNVMTNELSGLGDEQAAVTTFASAAQNIVSAISASNKTKALKALDVLANDPNMTATEYDSIQAAINAQNYTSAMKLVKAYYKRRKTSNAWDDGGKISGVGDLAALGKTDPKDIIDAITGGIQKVRGGPSQEIPIQNVILILGGGYLLMKILSLNLRD